MVVPIPTRPDESMSIAWPDVLLKRNTFEPGATPVAVGGIAEILPMTDKFAKRLLVNIRSISNGGIFKDWDSYIFMRFHALGLQHTITSKEYCACAYTQKVLNFCDMMKARGHTVIHYGHEDSNVNCSEHVSVVSRELFKKVYAYDYRSNLFRWDQGDDVYKAFNKNAIHEISKRKRDGDFLLAFWGAGHREICDAHQDMIVVEPGIGYASGHFAPYKVWESYSIYHAYLGLGKVSNCFCDEKEWENDTIIPNYLDPKDFEYSREKDDYFLFIGRIGFAKGLDSAIEMTRRLGKKLIVAGQNSEEGLKSISAWPLPSHVEMVGHVDVETRKRLLSKAKAVVCFSKFIDPFCGVHAEALMSGTPVISSDRGFSRNLSCKV